MSGRGTNTSAVMAQRFEPHDSLDYFPTPPWATRALIEWLGGAYHGPDRVFESDLAGCTIWEPCAGGGHMSRVLAEAGPGCLLATDIAPQAPGILQHDFLMPFLPPDPREEWQNDGIDWVITNPPFRLAQQIAERALLVAASVALLVRLQFLEGLQRGEFFDRHPPTAILLFRERVTMLRGRCRRTTDTGSQTATAYAWVIWHAWRNSDAVTRFAWIPRCRKRLERPGDYDDDDDPAAGPLL